MALKNFTHFYQVVTVKEEWIAISILRLVEGEKAVVEGAGATALAAILAGELQELKGKRLLTYYITCLSNLLDSRSRASMV